MAVANLQAVKVIMELESRDTYAVNFYEALERAIDEKYVRARFPVKAKKHNIVRFSQGPLFTSKFLICYSYAIFHPH